MYAALAWEVESRIAVWDAMQTRRPRDAPLPLHAVPANTGILGMQALASECLYRSCQHQDDLVINCLVRKLRMASISLEYRRHGNLIAPAAFIPSQIAYQDVDVWYLSGD